MDERITRGVAEAQFSNSFALGVLTAIEVIEAHVPSISDEDESSIDDFARAYVVAMDESVDAADLAVRTCHCGKKIDGFYEYVDHLLSLLGKESHYGS